MTSPKYEYRSDTWTPMAGEGAEAFLAWLNRQGRMGWEVVEVVESDLWGPGLGRTVLFKRRKDFLYEDAVRWLARKVVEWFSWT